jgi:chromosomal replication initiation ATPase DnaA
VKNQSKMHNTSTLLIEVLLKTIDKMGIKKTIQVLKISQSLSDENQKLINLIIVNTCKHFQITELNLKHGRGKINRTNAIIVASALLKRMANLNQVQIAEIFNKDKSSINKYLRKFDSLDPNFFIDAELLNKMDDIRQDVLKDSEKI